MKTRANGETEAKSNEGVAFSDNFIELNLQVLHHDTDLASSTIVKSLG
jgi:hypothetical protein